MLLFDFSLSRPGNLIDLAMQAASCYLLVKASLLARRPGISLITSFFCFFVGVSQGVLITR